MFKRIGRRFYSAKYVYVVHLHSVSPWFMHDRPAKVVWKRGTKKHKKGETSVKSPTRTEGTGVNGTLDIEEGFELGVTLYSVILSYAAYQRHEPSRIGKQPNKEKRTLRSEGIKARDCRS